MDAKASQRDKNAGVALNGFALPALSVQNGHAGRSEVQIPKTAIFSTLCHR